MSEHQRGLEDHSEATSASEAATGDAGNGDGWRWSLNWGVVRDDIVVGSCPMTTRDIDRIRKGTGASALLSVQTHMCREAFNVDYDNHYRHAVKRGLAMDNAPMRDFDPFDQRCRLANAVCSLHRLLSQDHRVYVYCTAGLNRSPLTVLGYLTFLDQMTPQDALALIVAGRPEAQPSWEAYEGCRQDLVERCRDAIARRAWDLAQSSAGGSAETHWLRAEKEVIRDVFLSAAVAPDQRLDPNRS